jgi:hypothetical protein
MDPEYVITHIILQDRVPVFEFGLDRGRLVNPIKVFPLFFTSRWSVSAFRLLARFNMTVILLLSILCNGCTDNFSQFIRVLIPGLC